MKKILIVCLFLISYIANGQDKHIRLNGYAYYVFDDAVDSYYSNTSYFNTTIKGGLVWGAGLEYVIQNANGIELLYLRQDTKAPTTYYNVTEKKDDLDVAINWIMLSFNRYQKFDNEKIEGYGGLGLGAAIFDVTGPDRSDNATKFAWALKLGVNIYASEKFGIKLQTGIQSAVQSVGGSVYFGTGGGGAGVSSYSSMLQFALGGGIVIPLGGQGSKATGH